MSPLFFKENPKTQIPEAKVVQIYIVLTVLFCFLLICRGIVLVALSRGPLYYEELFKSKGNNIASSNKWSFFISVLIV